MVERASEAAVESAGAMLVASVREEAARSGCSDVRGEEGWVEIEEGAGVLSEVRDAEACGWKR